MCRSLSTIVVGIGLTATNLACAPARSAPDRGLSLARAEPATCRASGPVKTLGHGWKPGSLHAEPSEHEVALGFFQMPRSDLALSVDPWSLDIVKATERTVDAPLHRQWREARAVGEQGTLVVWQRKRDGALEWTIRGEDQRERTEVRAMTPASASVSLESPSAIALPDGRFALGFVHVSGGDRAAMILTLSAEGRPLGDPTALWPDGDAFEARLARAHNGRAMAAFFDATGDLRGVPVACGGAK